MCIRDRQLIGSGPIFQESSHLLVDSLLYLVESVSRARRNLNDKLAAYFPRIHEDAYVAGDLVVVNQPFVQPRSLPFAQNGADQTQVVICLLYTSVLRAGEIRSIQPLARISFLTLAYVTV